MVAIFLVGLVAFPSLPVAPLPQVDFPTISVSAPLPGASPETMATSVAQPLERQIAQIPGVSQMTSTSSLGATAITVQFDLDRNIDAAANDIQAAINAASGQLPKDLPTPPTYRKVNPSDTPILILSVQSDVAPIIDVDDAAENILAQRISQISGVSLVRVGGQQKPAIRIQIDPAKLVEKNLQLEDVRAQIGIATVDSPKGAIIGQKQTFTIYDNDQLTTAKPWNDVIVAYRNGAPVRVRDIGQAVDGPDRHDPGGLEERQARRLPGRFQAARRERHQHGRGDQEDADEPRGGDPAHDPCQRAVRPHNDHPRLGQRRRVHAAADHRARRDGDLRLPAQLLGDDHSQRHGAAGAARRLRADVDGGYSLDNLSLMAFTIAVGFVVDDAIVMLENITRHIEEGEKPFQAALKGAAEIGFTIISISISLVAVLIPLLMMSGIIGRLFREFSVTIAMTIAVSALVALTLTPMMASRFLKAHDEERHGRLYNLSEAAFVALARGYERGLDFVLRHRFATLMTFLATVVATVYLFAIIPKGFFPQQDTGIVFGTTEAAQDISFPAMYKLQEQAGAVVMEDPAVATMAMGLGAGVGNSAQNNGRMFITLKPREERDVDVFQVIARLRPQAGQDRGSQGLPAGGAGRYRRRPLLRTQFQYTLQDANLDELNAWAPKILDKLQALPELRDVATDQQNAGTTLTLKIDRDMASRFGIQPQLIDDTLYDAFGQRQVTQYFTQVNTYDVIEEVLPDLQSDPATLDKIYIRSPTTNQMVPLSAFAKWTTAPVQPLSISHQGQFPAITISFNLAQGVALGQATEAVQKAEAGSATAAQPDDHLPGQRAGVPGFADHRAAADPGGAGRVYIILGMLYESFIHPLTILSTLPSAGLGRARDADAVRLRVQPDRADRDDPADRHRQEERHHDGRFRHRRRARRGPDDRRGDPQGGAPALPADHDDDHGGPARRRAADAQPRHGLGTAPAARLHHGRRSPRQPGADPVHDAGHLSLSRPAVALALGRIGQGQIEAPQEHPDEPAPEPLSDKTREPAWAEQRAAAE